MTELKGSRYVFGTDFEGERRRLSLGTGIWDAGTIQELERSGISSGWRCLEVGAGTGSIAVWLQRRVGAEGEVVATDLRTEWLDWTAPQGVTVLRHDVEHDEVPGDGFDLIHARMVLQHVATPASVVGRLVRALRPGGWLVLEDTDTSSLFYSVEGRVLEPVLEAAYAVMRSGGHEPRGGLRDVELMEQGGVVEVEARGRAVVVESGSSSAQWYALWLEHLRPRMVRSGAIGHGAIDHAVQFLTRPGARWLSQVMITSVGRARG